MTENEAKEVVKKLRNKAELFKNSGFAVDGIVKSFEDSANAIETLSEEIQQYRAIGTVEGYEKAIQATTGYYLLMKEYKSKVQDFEAIGTVDEFKALKEKNVAKKPRFYAHNYYCTECGNLVGNNEFEWQRFLYCDKCGQKLDWE
jgi:hypothetical protein